MTLRVGGMNILQNGDQIKAEGGIVRREMIGENERVVREVVRKEIMGSLKNMKQAKQLAWMVLW